MHVMLCRMPEVTAAARQRRRLIRGPIDTCELHCLSRVDTYPLLRWLVT